MSEELQPFPRAPDAEKNILGAMLTWPGEVATALGGRLRAADFDSSDHGRVWTWMQAELDAGRVPTTATLASWAERQDNPQGLELVARVSGFADEVSHFHSPAQWRALANAILRTARARRFIIQCEQARSAAFGEDLERAQEVWAAASDELDSAEVVELSEHLLPALGAVYDADRFLSDARLPMVSLAQLPGWCDAVLEGEEDGRAPDGHGWGERLDHILGGGIRPPYILVLGASSAGGGKTAFAHQVADGLALRTAELLHEPGGREPLTPVIILSEMGPQVLTWRSVGRWIGVSSRVFRCGESAAARLNLDPGKVDAIVRRGHQALVDGPLAEARFEAMRMWRAGQKDGRGRSTPARGPEMLHALGAQAGAWKAQLEARSGRAVWPVVLIDPLQRWQDTDNEVEALNALAGALLEIAEEHGLIVLCTSDTTKANASIAGTDVGSKEWAARMLRGSYGLTHVADACLALYTPLETVEQPYTDSDGKQKTRKVKQPYRREPRETQMAMAFAKNRWGACPQKLTSQPRWWWTPTIPGRFIDIAHDPDHRPMKGRHRGRGPDPKPTPLQEADPLPPRDYSRSQANLGL